MQHLPRLKGTLDLKKKDVWAWLQHSNCMKEKSLGKASTIPPGYKRKNTGFVLSNKLVHPPQSTDRSRKEMLSSSALQHEASKPYLSAKWKGT